MYVCSGPSADCTSLDVWTVDDLIAALGSIDRSAAIRALSTWVELGVLKEDSKDQYRLLKSQAETDASIIPRSGARRCSCPL